MPLINHKLQPNARGAVSQLGGAVRKRAAGVPEACVGRQLGFQHPIAAARLPHRGQPLAHSLGRELCVEDALRSQKSLARSSVAKLTLGRCPSEKALGSHGISPARAAGQAVGCAACESHGQPSRRRCADSRCGSHRSSNLARRGCQSSGPFCQAPQVAKGPAPQPPLPSPLWPALRRAQEALYIVGSAYDLRRRLRLRPWAGQYIHAHVLSSVLGELGAEGLRRREPCCSCAHQVRCCLRSVGRAAQTARDGGRALAVVRQRVCLWVSCQVVLAEAVSSALASSVASAGVRKPSSGIALSGVCCRGCGLGSSLDWTKSSK